MPCFKIKLVNTGGEKKMVVADTVADVIEKGKCIFLLYL